MPAAGWTPQEDERAEQDVLHVMNLVTKEYNVDTTRVYLHGQNPSGSGALYLAAKYPDRFAAVVVSSAPIVFETYPFDKLKGRVALMVVHGDQDTTNPDRGVAEDGGGGEGRRRRHGVRHGTRRHPSRGVSHLRVADLRLPGAASQLVACIHWKRSWAGYVPTTIYGRDIGAAGSDLGRTHH